LQDFHNSKKCTGKKLKKTKVTTFVGTRPEIIRLASIIEKFDQIFDHRLIHTGQNPDPLMRDVFLNELGVRTPDVFFQDNHESLGGFLGNLFVATEKELKENRPDAILILGDTNSALAAIIAKRLGVPIYHLEAGNRSFDSNVPEEINRRIVDHISDMNFPYSELARANLISEGIHPRKIALMGSPLPEVFSKQLPNIKNSKVLDELKLKPQEYFLVSAHRQENVDSPERLAILINTLNEIANKYDNTVLVSTHPRTRIQLEKLGVKADSRIVFHPPFGFLDYNQLQINARMVLSDSGTVSEESVILGFPALTIRDSMERPEALEAGSIIMCGINSDQVLEAIEIVEKNPESLVHPHEYQFPDTSTRVANVLLSTVHQQSFWSGLRKL
jgi:UDP-N-acetylglucosamine 2-epimerase (non-hydrolysing)